MSDIIISGSSVSDDIISVIVDGDIVAARDDVRTSAEEALGYSVASQNSAVASEASSVASQSQVTIATNKATEATSQAIIATTKASEASASASSASTSVSTATTQAGIATTKASEALVSANNSFSATQDSVTAKNLSETAATTSTTQAGIATTKAAEAVASAAAALVSENNAAASEASALLSKTDIDTKLDAVQSNGNTAQENINIVATDISSVTSIADNMTDVTYFADIYQGAKAVAPTLRNDGSGLVAGDLYFDTVDNIMFVYDGSTWGETTSAVNGVEKSEEFIATGGQTLFTLASGYDVGFINVFREGMLLGESEYTADNGSTITLNVACIAGDIVKVQAFGAFSLADHYTKAEQDVIDTAQDVVIATKAPQATTYTKTEVDTEITNRSFGFKNHIINGGFDIWQRGTSQASYGYGSADRFWIGSDGAISSIGKFTSTFNGSPINMLVSDVSGQTYNAILQRIEGMRKLQGKTMTLSFIVAGTVGTHTQYLEFRDSTGTVIATSTFDIDITNTNTKYTYTFTAPVNVAFDNDLAYYNVSFYGGNVLYVGQVQLEEGSVATPFEQRPIGLELSLCQRYYQQFVYYTSGSYDTAFLRDHFHVSFLAKMRATPTIVVFDVVKEGHVNCDLAVNPPALILLSDMYASFRWNNGDSGSRAFHYIAAGNLGLDAEL